MHSKPLLRLESSERGEATIVSETLSLSSFFSCIFYVALNHLFRKEKAIESPSETAF